MIHRAYAVCELRAVGDGEQRTFEGMATTPQADRLGDVIEPKGAKFKNPLPLLHQHDSDRPIGQVRLKRATDAGIEFTATIPTITEPGPLKDRVDTAWGEIKAGLIRAVSIGFRVLRDGMEALPSGDGWRFTSIEIVELSAVSVPANTEATITNIKALDRGARGSAPGPLPVVKVLTPAASGQRTQPETQRGTAMPPTISQQIEAFGSTRAAKLQRMAAIMDGCGDRGETMDAAETEEYDGLSAEVKSLDGQLTRLRDLETAQANTAAPVIRTAPTDTGKVTEHTVEPQVRTVDQINPALRVARLAKCLILARMSGGLVTPLATAADMYPNDVVLPDMVKAAVAGATVHDPNWAGALVGPAGTAFAAFLEYLRPLTILGRFGTNGVPALQAVPFRTPLGAQTSGGKGFWVGEGKAKPLTRFDFTRTSLDPLKVANIAVATKELIRDSRPSADGLIQNGLVAALRERLDEDFVDPAKAAVAGVSPASITNGVAAIHSSGNTAEDVRADVAAVYAAYKAGNNPLTGGVWLMPSGLAVSLGLMHNLLGQLEFPGVTPTGGTFAGFPVLASDYIPADTVVLVNAPLIYLADEGGFSVAMSDEASLEMVDAPVGDSGTPTGAATMVSMFQTNSVAILAERTINWTKARPNAAVVLDQVHWGEPAP